MHRARPSSVASFLLFALLLPTSAPAAPLVLDGTGASGPKTMTLGGVQTYSTVTLVNGARLYVTPFDGLDRVNKGNLVLKADTISVDATSMIVAKGGGYPAQLCRDGSGPATYPAAGGRGGCAVRDSAGGGAHLGSGGRGTTDSPPSFPYGFEEDCGDTVSGSACASYADCRTRDGLPTVAGQSFQHSPWSVEFGAAGGDKGCRDGDGFTAWAGTTNALSGGAGGGRIVLMVSNAAQTGQLTVNGVVNADGARGCGNGNDSGGGGAGGSVLLIGDSVTIGSTARISASGGRGGDEQPKCLLCATAADCGAGQSCVSGRCSPCNCTPCTTNLQCLAALGQTCKALGGSFGNVCADASNQCTPVDVSYDESECKGSQNSGTCDDCGGGGGGGEVRVLSRVSSISPLATFQVKGGFGGVCPICSGEAGGGAGELQIDGAYVGEICDGWDNDFNGSIDDGLPPLDCGGASMPSCVNGVPQQCPVDPGTCQGTVTDTRPRFVVLVDTSVSMLLDPAGNPTFGDGSVGHLGCDTSSDSDVVDGNNSRLFIAKNALNNVLAAFPHLDFALARYHQDVALNRSCTTASWQECQSVCCSYDDPRNNVTPAFPPVPGCNLAAIYPGAGFPAALNANINVGWANQSDCINYAGSCGPPRRGADVLAGFGRPLQQRLMWIDGLETSFNSSTLPGDHCNFAGGGDCELRASGPRPVASAIEAIADYLKPVIQCDGAVPCRKYSVILLSGGTESCMGNPVASATALRSNVPGTQVNLYVIGLSVLPSEQAQLNALAAAGGTGAAFFASDQAGLSNAIATIAASSTNYEKCNGLDDNCNALVDEDFPDKGQPCDDGKAGVCRGTGVRVCNAAGDGTVCQITNPGGAASPEVCNGLDDDCDGLVDDGGVCAFCSPSPEVCNGLDDDCNGLTDDAPLDADQPCGLSLGECAPGLTSCVAGQLGCSGAIGPQPEACNGLDDDCDGIVDGMAAPCYSGPSGTSGVGLCRPGLQACTAAAGSGVPSWGACVGAVLPSDETCNGLDDDCDGVSDDHVADAMGHVTGEPCCQFADKCGTGACTFGAWACAGSQIVCAGGAGPTAERCNGVDDDCNGLTDDVPGIGSSCVTADFCAGALICEGTSGALRCAPAAGLEICNGADDDCDGTVDNPGAVAKNDPAIGVECSAPVAPYDHAPCKAGKSECVDGAARCVGAVLAAAESCNGLDDDCDGVTDGPGLCPAGTDCHRGSCQVPCEAGAAACPGQFRCVDGYCESPPDAGWPGVDAGEPEDSGAAADASPPGLDAGETIPMDASAPRDDASTAAAADAGGGGASAPGCSCQAGSGQAVPSTLLGLLLLGRLLSKGRRKAVRS